MNKIKNIIEKKKNPQFEDEIVDFSHEVNISKLKPLYILMSIANVILLVGLISFGIWGVFL